MAFSAPARSQMTSSCLSLLVALSLSTGVLSKQKQRPSPADIFADPQDDPNNPLRYIANNTLTAIAFTLIVLVALIQSFSMYKWGARWMLAMVIGGYTFALGIGTRFGLHTNPDGKGIYIVEYLFVVLSPCAFIAADYVLLGRLSRHLGCDKFLAIRPTRITAIFIASDVTTFLIQAAGGSLSISSTNLQGAINGSHIFLAGLAAQLVSFLTFTTIYAIFLYRVHKHRPDIWTKDAGGKWYNDWRTLAGALILSCIGILIRSLYRTIELSQGFEGHLATVEAFFYGLDTLPLFLAIVVYVPFWPGRFIPPQEAVPATAQADEERPAESTSASMEEKPVVE